MVNKDSLSCLTLRELRLKASSLGVPMYSRKSKAVLINQIALYQGKLEEKQKKHSIQFWRSSEDNHSNQSKRSINTRIVFLPRDPQWAYVFWEISESDRKDAQFHGANRLCIRLSDVTGIDDGTANRQILQEIRVDSHSTDWYLPIPMSDRDYRVEFGYRIGLRWISLGFSAVAKVPSLYPSDKILDQFVPFSLETLPSNLPGEVNASKVSNEQVNSSLHERLYQTATANFHKRRIGSEQFLSASQGQQEGRTDSGSGIWASGMNDSGLGGVAPRKRPFWLVADAELVLYGSTDPSAKVTIGGEDVPLTSDGTFRLQVPFRDGRQEYPIEAKDQEGKQRNQCWAFK